MRDAVAAIFADRANLAATLVDARGVVRSMRSLRGGVAHAACCFLYLAIWDVSFRRRHPWRRSGFRGGRACARFGVFLGDRREKERKNRVEVLAK